MGVCRQLPTDPRWYPCGSSPQRVFCIGPHMRGVMGIYELVYHGPNAALRSFSSRFGGHSYGTRRVRGGPGRRCLHFCSRIFRGSVFLWSRILSRWAPADLCYCLLIFVDLFTNREITIGSRGSIVCLLICCEIYPLTENDKSFGQEVQSGLQIVLDLCFTTNNWGIG
jgi:hypothetical protein